MSVPLDAGLRWLLAAALMIALLPVAAPSARAQSHNGPIATTTREADLPEWRRTSLHLYVNAKEAHAAMLRDPSILLIDVRTAGETIFQGVAKTVTRHIPYLAIDDVLEYDDKRQAYKLVPNPDFPKAVEQLFAERKLPRSAIALVICSGGERSAKAASYLGSIGYTAIYSVVDGFEGDGRESVYPGWRRSGLPWSMTLTKAQAYKSPSF